MASVQCCETCGVYKALKLLQTYTYQGCISSSTFAAITNSYYLNYLSTRAYMIELWRRVTDLTLQVTFSSQQEKDAFQEKLDAAKRLLLPDGPLQRETFCFLNALLDRVLTASPTPTVDAPTPPASGSSLLDTSGIHIYCKGIYYKVRF